ncbi:MAG: hypothetical protein AVO35_04620 [Candidatus Aegiribacteria sp. MLS_C]|nr:MAG: hypothetical protein AVO35_04620 [Candidatus Aegiribacteria sp. MLS_C]
MPVSEGEDFVFTAEMTYTGAAGTGRGCLLGSRDLILQLPVRTFTGSERTMGTRDWFIEGRPVVEYVRSRLEDPAIDATGLDGLMRELASAVEGAVLVDLSVVRRFKVRTSLLSGGIYTSLRDSGPGWKGFPLRKADAAGFRDSYRGHPASAGG